MENDKLKQLYIDLVSCIDNASNYFESSAAIRFTDDVNSISSNKIEAIKSKVDQLFYEPSYENLNSISYELSSLASYFVGICRSYGIEKSEISEFFIDAKNMVDDMVSYLPEEE